MMNRGSITETECIALCQECCQITGMDFSGDVHEFVGIVNDNIHSFHFKVSRGKREDTGETVYALASLASNDLNRFVVGGDFSQVELEFFRRTLELIVHADEPPNVGVVSSINLLNMANSLSPKMSKADAKKFLSQLVKDKWLLDTDGMISMAPRCILELEQYLTSAYTGLVLTCYMCSSVVFQGQSCVQCNVKLHNECAKKYFSEKSVMKCMSCGARWEFMQQSGSNGHVSNVSSHGSKSTKSTRRSRLTLND